MKDYLEIYDAEALQRKKASKAYKASMGVKVVDALEADYNKKQEDANKMQQDIKKYGAWAQDRFIATPKNLVEEAYRTVGGAVDSVVTDIGNTGVDVFNWLATQKTDVRIKKSVEDPKTGFGKVSKEILEFVIKFLPISKAASGLNLTTKLAKLGTVSGKLGEYAITAMIPGAVADFINDPDEGNFTTTMTETFPGSDAFLPDYFEYKIDDTELNKRLKNTIEGAALGAVADLAIEGVVKSAKYLRSLKKVKSVGLDVDNTVITDDTLKNVAEAIDTDQNIDEVLMETNNPAQIKSMVDDFMGTEDELLAEADKLLKEATPPTEATDAVTEGVEVKVTPQKVKKQFAFSKKGSGGKVYKKPTYLESAESAYSKDYIDFYDVPSVSKKTRRTALEDDMIDEFATEQFDATKRLLIENTPSPTKRGLERNIHSMMPSLPKNKVEDLANAVLADAEVIKLRNEVLGESIGETMLRAVGVPEEDIPTIVLKHYEDIRRADKAEFMTSINFPSDKERKAFEKIYDTLYSPPEGSGAVKSSRLMLHPATFTTAVGGAMGTRYDLDRDGEVGTVKDVFLSAMLGLAFGIAATKSTKETFKTIRSTRIARLRELEAAKDSMIAQVNKRIKLLKELDAMKIKDPKLRERLDDVIPVLEEAKRLYSEVKDFPDYIEKIQHKGIARKLNSLMNPPIEIDPKIMKSVADDIVNGNFTDAAAKFNFRYKDINDEMDVVNILNTVEAMLDANLAKYGKAIPTETTEAAAMNLIDKHGALGLINSVSKQLASGKGAAKVHATNLVLSSLSSKFLESARVIADLGDNVTPEVLADFHHKFAALAAVEAQVNAIRSESGRMLQILKKTSRAVKGVSKEEADFILKNMGETSDVVEFAKKIAMGAEDEASKGIALAKAAGWKGALKNYYMWSMLSGVPTQLRNITGSAMMTARYMGATLFEDRAKFANQVGTLYNSFLDCLILATDTFKGKGGLSMGSKYGMDIKDAGAIFGGIERKNKYLTPIMDFLDMASSTTFRGMNAGDEFFYNINLRLHLSDDAFMKAQKEAAKFAPEMQDEVFSNTYAHYMTNPTNETWKASTEFSQYQTFRNELAPMEKQVMKLLKSDSPWIRGFATLFMPFAKTGMNILRDSVAFSFGWTTKVPLLKKVTSKYIPNYTDLVDKGILTEKQANAMLGMGFTLLSLGGLGNLMGFIRGGEGAYESPTRRARFSMDIGNRNIGFDGLDPVAFPIGAGAAIVEVMQKEISDLWNDPNAEGVLKKSTGLLQATLISSAITVAQFMLDKSYIQGLADFFNIFNSPYDSSTSNVAFNFAKNLSQKAVPAIASNIEDMFDPTMNEVYSIIDAVASKLPGVSLSTEKRLDLYGKPIISRRPTFSPVSIATISPDPLLNKLEELDIDTGRRFREMKTIHGVTLNAKQYTKYRKFFGAYLDENKDKILESTEKTEEADIQKQILNMWLSTAKSVAQSKMLQTEPTLITDIKLITE